MGFDTVGLLGERIYIEVDLIRFSFHTILLFAFLFFAFYMRERERYHHLIKLWKGLWTSILKRIYHL